MTTSETPAAFLRKQDAGVMQARRPASDEQPGGKGLVMAFRKINTDEFEEESRPKIRRVKLSDLKTKLRDNKREISNINKRINYFKGILLPSTYPYDVRNFLNTLRDEREMYTDGIKESEALITKLEKM